MILQGKGFFTNILSECEGGEAASIAFTARQAGLSFVVLKIAEENRAVAGDSLEKATMAAVIQALQNAGISVWGWHHIRGNDPTGEARTASECIQALKLAGYIINAEAEFEQSGGEASARQFMAALKEDVSVPVALCSYHLPKYHPGFPWSAFLQGCDLHMPKVFWEQAHNAGEQLRESRLQSEALPNARPYIPVGAAYRTTGWAPLPEDIADFLVTAQALDLPAAGFFQWDHCRKYLPKVWEAISEYAWVTSAAPVPPAVSDTFPVEFLAALNSRETDRVVTLYDPGAVCTWMQTTMRGTDEIRQVYKTFFKKLPEGSDFTLVDSSVKEGEVCLTWKAGSLTGETTLIVKNMKIVQENTYMKP
jgi:hypothetical protein